jgi:hypothetical protein
MATKELVKWIRKIERQVNRMPVKKAPVKVKTKVVRHKPVKRYTKDHAGINGKHDPACKGVLWGTHCRHIITAYDARHYKADKGRIGQKCGVCMPLYVGWRGWDDLLNGPVCHNHFHAAMDQKASALRAARRR